MAAGCLSAGTQKVASKFLQARFTHKESREEKIKLSSGVRCPVSVCPCVRNSYLSTSATNQDKYEDKIDDDTEPMAYIDVDEKDIN
jgi:hypothetical protein